VEGTCLAYPLPNDGKEQDRLDFVHAIYMLIWNDRLHFAPLERPRRVLDIGTGTGIWAIQFAERNPETQVVGTDLSMTRKCNVPDVPRKSLLT
jgi:tRNA G46 methylase TrmB